MTRTFFLVAAIALVLGACAESDDASEGVEYNSVVSTVLRANVGPDGEEQDFVVEVTHDDERVSRDEARRLAANVRIQEVTAQRARLGDGVVPADNHWGDDDDHGFRVRVRPVIDEGKADHLRELAWEWMEEAVAALHCPPGH